MLCNGMKDEEKFGTILVEFDLLVFAANYVLNTL